MGWWRVGESLASIDMQGIPPPCPKVARAIPRHQRYVCEREREKLWDAARSADDETSYRGMGGMSSGGSEEAHIRGPAGGGGQANEFGVIKAALATRRLREAGVLGRRLFTFAAAATRSAQRGDRVNPVVVYKRYLIYLTNSANLQMP